MGQFYLESKQQYWIENNAQWPQGDPNTMSRIIIYPELDPSFSPRLYLKDEGGNLTKFVDDETIEPNLENIWYLYETDLNNSFLNYLEHYTAPANEKYFCFDLSQYPNIDYFSIIHVLQQTNAEECMPAETRQMYFTSQRYDDETPDDPHCPR